MAKEKTQEKKTKRGTITNCFDLRHRSRFLQIDTLHSEMTSLAFIIVKGIQQTK